MCVWGMACQWGRHICGGGGSVCRRGVAHPSGGGGEVDFGPCLFDVQWGVASVGGGGI